MCRFFNLKEGWNPLGEGASYHQLFPLYKVAGNNKDTSMNLFPTSVTFCYFGFFLHETPFFPPPFKDHMARRAVWGQRHTGGPLRLWVLQGSKVRRCPPTPASPASLRLSAVPPPPSFLTPHPGCFLTVGLVTVPRASLRSSLFFPDPLSSGPSRSCHVFFELTKR